MNVMTKRLLAGVAIVLIGLIAAAQVSSALSAQQRLELDQSDLNEMVDKLDEIQAVAESPRVVALEVEAPDDILNRINAALKSAGLPQGLLANQTPSAPQRIGRSDFSLRRVEITLGPARVSQIVAFCNALKDEETGSLVRDMQLYDPKQQGRGEMWSSQLTLTQIIFSPTSDS